MSALANKDDVETPRSDFMSIDQKITFEMENIEEKLQRMLQSRADAIDRELQERWPKLRTEGGAAAESKNKARHCLQPPSRMIFVPPAIEVDEPRSVARRPSSGAVVVLRDRTSLDRAVAAMRGKGGAVQQHRRSEPSPRARLRALMSHVRTLPGAIDWPSLRSSLAGVLGHLSMRGAWSPALTMRFSRWSGGKRYG